MYKYKDKEFEIIEMTSSSNRLSWGTPFDSRAVDQAEWGTIWGVSGEGNIEWIQEPPTIDTFNLTRSRQGGIYGQISQRPTVNYKAITIEDLEGALREIFYGQMERTRVSRSRRSGMSTMASAVEIQRTLGIP